MKFLLCLLPLLGLAAASIAPGSPIQQCQSKDLECPFYTLKAVEKTYEVRTYPGSRWASTISTAVSTEDYNSTVMFNKLFKYISGANDKSVKIPMTAPVLTEVMPGPGPNCDTMFTMSFFVPTALWDQTPKPLASDVFIQDLEETTVYVKAFGGHASMTDYIAAAAELAKDIGDSSKFVQSVWFTAGYDAPYRVTERRNEVFFIAK